ncbi:MAG: DUF4932 domain-containing protein [candidate division WWE3 bacterium]|nr:DUF4932 domain-containing protein [candidate division WWE3 bacterium]
MEEQATSVSSKISVETNKNIFLLYSLLNNLGQAYGDLNSHPLRKLVTEHFRGYKGPSLKVSDYIHESKAVTFILTLGEAPDFSPRKDLLLTEWIRSEVNRGSAVLPAVKHFYSNTDFEDFYNSVKPQYQEIADYVSDQISKVNLDKLLNEVWELETDFKQMVIPNPLTQGSFGPEIGETLFQVIGTPFSFYSLHTIAHEASHPKAKKVLEPCLGEIWKHAGLIDQVLANSSYSKAYNSWETCVEEHFIRAIKSCYSDPAIFGETPEFYIEQEEQKGMVFIRDFCDEINAYKEHKISGTLGEVVLKIIDRLEK